MIKLPFQDPLNQYQSAQLLTPALPEPVSLMPETAGWVWLGVFLLAVAGKLWLNRKAKRLQNVWRTEALTVISQAARNNDLSGLYTLILRIARLSIPKEKLRTLSAGQVLSELNLDLSSSQFRNLLAARYRPAGKVVDDSLFSVLSEWVKTYPHV